ncbi:MAG: hypothetical protein WDO14_01205 [Bacteroidota bacterium]
MYRLSVILFFVIEFAAAQKPGTVVESITCIDNPAQTYALYVPASYTKLTPVGLILLFDPGARGNLPVSLYQKLADKHNVILACSNNSHNGPVEPCISAGNSVLDDVLARFNVDRSFMLASGFSGGGRVAVEFALRRGTMAGVITCGAALPSQTAITKTKQIPFVEVIGQLDMNYQEAISANMYLKTIANPAFLILFYGGHEWPPVSYYEDAIEYHKLRNKKMKASDFFSDQMKRVKVQTDSGYLYEANRMLMQLVPDFQQSNEVFTLDAKLASVQKDKRFKAEATEIPVVNSKEVAMQTEFRTRYKEQLSVAKFQPAYWQQFRRDCDAMLTKDHYTRLAGLRLVDFGWRLCSEQQYFFEQNKQSIEAANSKKILDILSTSGVKGR